MFILLWDHRSEENSPSGGPEQLELDRMTELIHPPTSDTSQEPVLRGVVIRAFGNRFTVKSDSDEYDCAVRLTVKRDSPAATPVAAGDDVEFTLIGDGRGIIERVAPRRTSFSRPWKGISGRRQTLAANVDQLAIVVSVKEPPLKPGLIDRFTVSAAQGGLDPLVVINKIDLGRTALVSELEKAYRQIDIPVCTVCAAKRETLSELEQLLSDKRTLFVGHSGVGKSTLLNTILPELNIKTAEVSKSTRRGRHITTRVELHALPGGGYLVDSPGLKVLSFWEISRRTLPGYFKEFAQFRGQCRFDDCLHISEPGCAVKGAVDSGRIPGLRYESYLKISDTL